MPKLFVDADGFIALAKEDDTNHKKAVKLLQEAIKNDATFITSNYVFSEVVTVLSQRLSHKAALEFIEKMKFPASGYNVKWVDENIEQEAISIFSDQTTKNISFVDCTNMAIMRLDKLDAIFSFDGIYRKNGFSIFDSQK